MCVCVTQVRKLYIFIVINARTEYCSKNVTQEKENQTWWNIFLTRCGKFITALAIIEILVVLCFCISVSWKYISARAKGTSEYGEKGFDVFTTCFLGSPFDHLAIVSIARSFSCRLQNEKIWSSCFVHFVYRCRDSILIVSISRWCSQSTCRNLLNRSISFWSSGLPPANRPDRAIEWAGRTLVTGNKRAEQVRYNVPRACSTQP